MLMSIHRSLTIGRPRNYGDDPEKQSVGLDRELYNMEMMRTKLWETTVPMTLNQSYVEKLVVSYHTRPRDVHNIFLTQLPNRVDVLDGANITKWVSETIPGRKDWSARAILASDKDMVPSLYTKLAIDYCCSGRIRFGFVKGREPGSKSALETLKVSKFPTLLMGKGQALGSGKDTDTYGGKLNLAGLTTWAKQYDDSRLLKNLVPEIHDQGVMKRECLDMRKGWCIILLMPHDIAQFDDALEIMQETAGRRYPPQVPAKFFWVHTGRQQGFTNNFDHEFANKDKPAVLALKMNGPTKMYRVFEQAEFTPKKIRGEVFNCIYENEATEFKHVGDKVSMFARRKPVDLENLADDEEAYEAELEANQKKAAGRRAGREL